MTFKPFETKDERFKGTGAACSDYLLTSDIATPRTWEEQDIRIQKYMIELECFTILRQIMEMNVKKAQALDLLTATLMQHDPRNALAFRQAMMKVHDRYQYDRTYTKGLMRYFWCTGMGINKIGRYTRMGQHRIYRTAYEIAEDLENGRLITQIGPFINEKFIFQVDLMIRTMTTFEGYEARKPKVKTTKFDIFRSSLKRESVLGRDDV